MSSLDSALDRLVFALALGVALAVLLPGIASPVGYPDMWMHLAAGEAILQDGGLPALDGYAHTSESRPWVLHSWASELGMLGVHRLAGLGGLRLLLVGLLLAGGVAYCALLRGLGYAWPLALAGAWGIQALAVDRIRLRPELVSYLLIPILILALERWRAQGRGWSRWVALALGCTALWSNLHPGVLTVPVLAGLLWVAPYLLRWGEGLLRRDPELLRWEQGPLTGGLPWEAPLLLAAATLLNPYGWGLYVYAAEVGSHGKFVSEWYPAWINFASPPRWGMALAPFVALLGVGYQLIWGEREASSRAWLLPALACIGLAGLRVRLLYLLFVPFATCLPLAWRKPRRSLRLGACGLLLACTQLLAVHHHGIRFVLSQPGVSVRPDQPHAAQTLFRALELPLRLWHPASWGSYLSFRLGLEPAVKIFVDGRLGLYSDTLLENQLWLEGPFAPGETAKLAQRDALLERYGVEAVLDRRGHFAASSEWFWAYASPQAEVFLHHERGAAAVARTLELHRRLGVDLPPELPAAEASARIRAFLEQATPGG